MHYDAGVIESPRKVKTKKRKVENKTVTSFSHFGDFSAWESSYSKQENLELLRLYFSTIGWEIIQKVYPDHKMLERYKEYLASPKYFSKKLGNINSIDEISESMTQLGSSPKYANLALTEYPCILQNPCLNSVDVKTECEN